MAAKQQTVRENTYVVNFLPDKKVSAERTMQCSPARRSEDVSHLVRFMPPYFIIYVLSKYIVFSND